MTSVVSLPILKSVKRIEFLSSFDWFAFIAIKLFFGFLLKKRRGDNIPSPHFTHSSPGMRLMFFPNKFTFSTLYVGSKISFVCFTVHKFHFAPFILKNKYHVKWGLPVVQIVSNLTWILQKNVIILLSKCIF